MSVTLYRGDCRDVLPTLADASVDAIITDPPYPEIDRPYGRLTEAEWWDLMMAVCREARRVLKPTGSAVFVLQPNSRKVGSMRGWLFEFQAWACREWNMVQDHWSWNFAMPPTVHCHRDKGLSRPSVRALVWLGPINCYRNQSEVLWEPSMTTKAADLSDRALRYNTSGHHGRRGKACATALDRGGSVPFNLLPVANTNSQSSSGACGHGAGTPKPIADWWTRYICPPGGTCLDPFLGGGTMALAAVKRDRSFVGIERHPPYVDITVDRLAAEGVLMAADPALLPLDDLWTFV